MVSKDNIRVGVIGVGHLGQHHARIYASLPGTTLVGVSDLDTGRGHQIGRQHGVKFFEDYHDLLEQVHAVSVAVPTSIHGEVVHDCLQKGIHVLVEKPIASTIEAGRGMVALAREKGVRLQVGHVERFNPILDLIRPVLDRPRFIQCNRLAPYQVRGTDVDVVLDLMIHDLDIVLSWGMGSIIRVDAVGASVTSRFHDFAKARIEFDRGCVAEFTASRVSSNRLRNFSLYQPSLYMSADFQTRQGVLYRKDTSGVGAESMGEETFQAGSEDALTRELEAFVCSIRDGVDHGVSGEEGMQALDLAHQVLSVLALGGRPTEKSEHNVPSASIGIH